MWFHTDANYAKARSTRKRLYSADRWHQFQQGAVFGPMVIIGVRLGGHPPVCRPVRPLATKCKATADRCKRNSCQHRTKSMALKQVESPEAVITRPRKDVKQAEYVAFKKAMPSSAGEKLRTKTTGHDCTGCYGITCLRGSRRGYRAHLCSRNALAISADGSGELSVRPVGGFVGYSFQAQAEHAQNEFSQIKQGGGFFMRPSDYPESIANTLLWSKQKNLMAIPSRWRNK